MNGRPITALLDPGSTVTLAIPTALGPLPKPMDVLPVSCIHRNIWEVPAIEVLVFSLIGSWPLLVGLILELPLSLLLGFPKLSAMRIHHC